jgi:hypothetical protein
MILFGAILRKPYYYGGIVMNRRTLLIVTILTIMFVGMCGCNPANTGKSPNDTSAKLNTSEGDALFIKYYDEIKGHPDPRFKIMYNNRYSRKETLAKHYVSYCNGTVEEWQAKSEFEQMLIYETYLTIAPLADEEDENRFNRYFGSEESYFSIIGGYYEELKDSGYIAISEAYKELMRWQYRYIIEYKSAYNFMANFELY